MAVLHLPSHSRFSGCNHMHSAIDIQNVLIVTVKNIFFLFTLHTNEFHLLKFFIKIIRIYSGYSYIIALS